MAKNKKDKAERRDRRDAGKLPKRIAGVKVPKALRKGGALRELAESQMARDILAAALTSAAAVIAGGKGGKGKDGEGTKPGTGPIVAAFAAAAVDVVRQLRAGSDKAGPDKKASETGSQQPAGTAKPGPTPTTH